MNKTSSMILSALLFAVQPVYAGVRCDNSVVHNRIIYNTQSDSYNGRLWVTTRWDNKKEALFQINNTNPTHALEIFRMAQLAQLLQIKVGICYYDDQLYTLMLNEVN